MGLAKEKMFGKSKKGPLHRFIENGALLTIDVVFAHRMKPKASEEELAIQAALLAAVREGHLCLERTRVQDEELAQLIPPGRYYLPKYEQLEKDIVQELKRLIRQSIESMELIDSSQANAMQKQAIQNASLYPISIITGGPGTGKSFTASQIVQSVDQKVIVAAPTGKAAAHLGSKMPPNIKAATLHSLLKEGDPLDASLIIVDESSMIDAGLFLRLLRAIKPGARLVLMGDGNQLPAVEGGSVFSDLIDSKQIPTTTLQDCLRSDQREILELADAVLQGTAKNIVNCDLGFEENQLDTIYERLWEYTKDKDFSNFRILSTLRKGLLGVDALNAYLFEQFSSFEKKVPIIITRNDPKTGLSNGETGWLISDTAYFGDKTFRKNQLPTYEYAYCISVHKSQGSEYGEVLFLMPKGSEQFGKEVIYTAITRAKKTLLIDGDPQQIANALKRSSRKISGICERMQTWFENNS